MGKKPDNFILKTWRRSLLLSLLTIGFLLLPESVMAPIRGSKPTYLGYNERRRAIENSFTLLDLWGERGDAAKKRKYETTTVQRMFNHFGYDYNTLDTEAKTEFEKKYPAIKTLKTDDERQEFFKDRILDMPFEKGSKYNISPSDVSQYKEILRMRQAGEDTRVQRALLLTNLSKENDLDGHSDIVEKNKGWGNRLKNAFFDSAENNMLFEEAKANSGGTLRERLDTWSKIDRRETTLNPHSEKATESMTPVEKKNTLSAFEKYMDENIPQYSQYKNTDKIAMDDGWVERMYNQYVRDSERYGDYTANVFLREDIQNIVAEHQTTFEKAVNAGAQFTDGVASVAIGGVGLGWGLAEGLVGVGLEDDENYFSNLIEQITNNKISRYANLLSETHVWNPEEQELYHKKGWSDNAILNSVKQENSIFNANTFWEVIGRGSLPPSLAAAPPTPPVTWMSSPR